MSLDLSVPVGPSYVSAYGTQVSIYPADSINRTEVWRAPDNGSGAANDGAAVQAAILPPSTTAGVIFVDLLPNDGALRFYKSRMLDASGNASAFTGYSEGQSPSLITNSGLGGAPTAPSFGGFAPSTVLPATPVEGEFVYYQPNHNFQFWNGSAWVVLSSSTTGVATVTGTANQVTASPTFGAVVVGLATAGILPGAWQTSGASFGPTTAAGATLGTLALPWGNAFVNDITSSSGNLMHPDGAGVAFQVGLTINKTFGTFAIYDLGGANLRVQVAAEGTVSSVAKVLNVGAQGTTPNAASLAWGDSSGWKLRFGTNVSSAFASRFEFVDTGDLNLSTTGTGTIDGGMTRFGGGAGPAQDYDVWSYSSGVSKWRPRFLQTTFTAGAVTAQDNLDATFANYANSNPSLSGTPAAPVSAPVVTPLYAGFIVDMSSYALPANTVYVLDYSTNGGAYTSGKIVCTSSRVVFTQAALNTATTYAFKFKARGGSDSAYSPASAAASTVNTTETNAFGIIIASQISCVYLSAIKANLGQIKAGQLENAAETAGIQLDATFAVPGTWTSGIFFASANPLPAAIKGLGIDATATGTNPILRFQGGGNSVLLQLLADGSMDFGPGATGTPPSGLSRIYSKTVSDAPVAGGAPSNRSVLFWKNDAGQEFTWGLRIIAKDTYTSGATWTKSASTVLVMVHVWGGGGGGGGGASATSGSASGGNGGGGGCYTFATYRAADLGATVAITVGGAGTAGTGGSNGNGGAGGNGGTSSFGTFIYAYGGAGGPDTTGNGAGGGGILSAGSGSAGGQPSAGFGGGAGGTSAVGGTSALGGAGGGGGSTNVGKAGGVSFYGGGGGASGGGVSSGTTSAGAAGGKSGSDGSGTLSGGGGSAGANPNGAGGAGANAATEYVSGAGGGGGGSGLTSVGSGGAGGAPGGGGGGGGAMVRASSPTGGNGGGGGSGQVIVYQLG